VLRTRVGYAGGEREAPTYRKMGDHTETVQVDFDPLRISYERMLEVFWESHDPAAGSWSRQYRNVIFFQNDRQREAAQRSRVGP
jgi:peptide-methionine (S)-S-oxide reductase